MTRTSRSTARPTKIETQLKRYMSRLRERRGEGDGAAIDENAAYTVFAAPADEEEPIPPAPPIVAETRVDIPEASVSDAVMMLDLRNTNALMFRNSQQRRISTWSIAETMERSAGSNRRSK